MQVFTEANCGARVSANGGQFHAAFLVNTRNGINSADAQCVSAKSFKTEAAAIRWAQRMIAEHNAA